MKAVLILPYFGKFPNYFGLYLKSIELNKDFNWLIITDDRTVFNYPDNVKVIYTEFTEIQQLFQTKFDFKISLETPHKLCDYKPVFGYVFEDYLKEYEYWGHCDSDMVFGKLDNFLDWNKLKKFDKIFTLGHLTLYKNTQENNLRFMQNERYKDVFTNPVGYAFDEKRGGSINDIFNDNNFPMFTESLCADIEPYHINMRLSIYNFENNSYHLEGIKEQIFTSENGRVYRYFIDKNNSLIKEEFMYIHLQKRKMNESFNGYFPSSYIINSNGFVALEEDISLRNFHKYYKKYFFNTQYLKIKWNSLKYKLKYKEYFYGSKKHF